MILYIVESGVKRRVRGDFFSHVENQELWYDRRPDNEITSALDVFEYESYNADSRDS